MARQHRSVVRTRGPRRKSEWAGTTVAATADVTVGFGSSVLVANIIAADLDAITPCTLVRVRGMFSIKSDQVAAAEEQRGAFGIAVVNEDARAIGATAIPAPQTNSDWGGWLYWRAFKRTLEVASGIGLNPDFDMMFEVDGKAMRKIDNNMAIVVMVENSNGSHGLLTSVNFRFLFLLH